MHLVERITPDQATRRVLMVLIAWNALDIALHVIADEVEPLRIAGNLVLIAVAGAVLADRAGAHPAHPLLPALVVFVVANVIVFIDKGRLPAAMTILVAVSVVLTVFSISRLRPPPEERRFGRKG